MPMTTKERTDLREELVGQGYSWEYVDEWPSKTTLYRHREIKNPNGEIVSAAGTAVSNLPGNPDYVNRKARQGLLQWPPSESCTCRWCVARNGTTEPVSANEGTQEAQEVPVAQKQKGKGRMGPYYQPS
jgi:hypothetical protein